MDWQLADAKNRFSELVRKALAEGPQRVRRRRDTVVVVSERDFEELCGRRKSFSDFLLRSSGLSDVDLSRDTSPMRDTEL